jgi:hypothetical protein
LGQIKWVDSQHAATFPAIICKVIRGVAMERPVRKVMRIPAAFKHGAYSATTVLPGEDPAAFEKLHQDLIAELTPSGALEEDVVATIARLVWRKQNLATLHIAQLAQGRRNEIKLKTSVNEHFDDVEQAELEETDRAVEDQAREELGDTYEFVEIGEAATFAGLVQDLAIEEQLAAMINKYLKRLLFLRGLKSISGTSSSVPPARIAGPSKAA